MAPPLLPSPVVTGLVSPATQSYLGPETLHRPRVPSSREAARLRPKGPGHTGLKGQGTGVRVWGWGLVGRRNKFKEQVGRTLKWAAGGTWSWPK